MDLRPIGVFDSGSGGLTAVREIRSILPSENIIYFGDTSRVPYGSRSAEILLRFAKQDVRFLRTFDIKALVVACGTVSTTALPQLQAENGDLPMLGVVEPSCRRAAASTRNKRVGLIATAAWWRTAGSGRAIPSSKRWRGSIWSRCGIPASTPSSWAAPTIRCWRRSSAASWGRM